MPVECRVGRGSVNLSANFSCALSPQRNLFTAALNKEYIVNNTQFVRSSMGLQQSLTQDLGIAYG